VGDLERVYYTGYDIEVSKIRIYYVNSEQTEQSTYDSEAARSTTARGSEWESIPTIR
jgi:hypothetical protein